MGNTEQWEQLDGILSGSRPPSATPAPGDSSLLVLSTFITALKNHREAKRASAERQISEQSTSESTTQQTWTLSTELVEQLDASIEELRSHFETLLSDPEMLSTALSGYSKGNVAWIAPASQRDFVDFINALASDDGASSIRDPNMSALIDWAGQTEISQCDIDAGIDKTTATYEATRDAFRYFRESLDRVVQTYERETAIKRDT